MYNLYMGDIYYLILVIPALIFALVAQSYVKSTFNKYSLIPTSFISNDIVEKMLHKNEIYDISIVSVSGYLSDHFNSSKKIISLSQPVYNNNSIAALGVACHEAGHALQYKAGYLPLKIRNYILPVVKFASGMALPLAIIGLMISDALAKAGVILFSVTVLFQLLLLPIEFNASKRAVNELDLNLSDEELKGVKKVLFSAALTYVASSLVAVANFLRILLIINGRNRRD
ncbi:MAG: zinc metallopeptidase [Clostridia bacterium]|nr:zinc metallopeptidase [Clostridia bacterium]